MSNEVRGGIGLRSRNVASQTRFQPWNQNGDSTYVYHAFKNAPTVVENDGTAATGVAGAVNNWSLPGVNLEQLVVGTQTVLNPVMGTAGLDIKLTNTAAQGLELTPGILASAKSVFTTGTDGAFFIKVKVKIATITAYTQLTVGFRAIGAYSTALYNAADNTGYDDHAVLGLFAGSGVIKSLTKVQGAGTSTSTSTSIVAATTTTLEVRVDKYGYATFLVDGVAVNTSTQYLFTAGTVVIPSIGCILAAASTTELVSYEVGPQYFNFRNGNV